MENLVNKNFWRKKNVLITGHTGFKGGWLSLWLHKLGARVSGYSLAPNEEADFYNKVYSSGFIGNEYIQNLSELDCLKFAIGETQPDIIFHLAAQPLVLDAYADTYSTFATNVMGLINLFEAIKVCKSKPTIINVTTDKVYENKGWVWAYRENDRLGGNDPYSGSKACSEIITNCYFQSFFKNKGILTASARAGNVIGGGDMSKNRLVPDFLRSLESKQSVPIRNPKAIRPWQHVLEPLSGYLILAQKLASSNGSTLTGSWNFGPVDNHISVETVVNHLTKLTGYSQIINKNSTSHHEAPFLMLDSSKSQSLLGWRPKLLLDTALRLTLDWFQASRNNQDMMSHSIRDIEKYETYV